MLYTAEQLRVSANRALFVDMNSFFASVEQQISPELRGRPVAVVPFIHDSTSVLAASVEAKRLGIHTGTNLAEARRLAPDITFRRVNATIYRDYHRRIMNMLDQTRCKVTVKSIDEALLVVPKDMRDHSLQLASEIRSNIYNIGDWLGCSIGLGPNMFIAKMATNAMKPNGLVQVLPQELEGFYGTLALEDLYGVARRNAKRFKAIGIETPLDLYHVPLKYLQQHLGENAGLQWHLRMRGVEVDQRPTNRGQVGHQTTFTPNPARSFEELWPTASQLTAKISHRLRTANLSSHRIVCFVRFQDRSHWSVTLNQTQYINDLPTMLQSVKQAFTHLNFSKPVRLVGISAINLKPTSGTSYSLFPEERKSEQITRAIDLITEKFGVGTINTARNFTSKKVVDSIGFGNAPDVAQMGY